MRINVVEHTEKGHVNTVAIYSGDECARIVVEYVDDIEVMVDPYPTGDMTLISILADTGDGMQPHIVATIAVVADNSDERELLNGIYTMADHGDRSEVVITTPHLRLLTEYPTGLSESKGGA
jgi:hypothetical protein